MSSSAPQTASVLNLSGNALLTALPAADQGRLAAHLERVSLRLGEMLYEPGKPPQHAYFPITAIISLHCALSSGVSSETASVGNDGDDEGSVCRQTTTDAFSAKDLPKMKQAIDVHVRPVRVLKSWL